MAPNMFIDAILACSIILIAILSLASVNLFRSIVLFISLGLVVTLAWARLGAWDVAIAEAAIGSGLTGALLLVTWRKLESTLSPRKNLSKNPTSSQHSPDNGVNQ